MTASRHTRPRLGRRQTAHQRLPWPQLRVQNSLSDCRRGSELRNDLRTWFGQPSFVVDGAEGKRRFPVVNGRKRREPARRVNVGGLFSISGTLSSCQQRFSEGRITGFTEAGFPIPRNPPQKRPKSNQRRHFQPSRRISPDSISGDTKLTPTGFEPVLPE